MGQNEETCDHDKYVRANRYDASWIREHQMGPHPLWLLEALSERISLLQADAGKTLGFSRVVARKASKT